MSYFDPYYLYTHPQRHSHKGQVIQKRPVNNQYAVTQEDLKRAIEVAHAYGYKVYKTLPVFNFSVFEGSVQCNTNLRAMSLSRVYNQIYGNALKRYNPDIFDKPHDNIRIIFKVTYMDNRITSLPLSMELIDLTTYNFPSIANYYITPWSSTELRMIDITNGGTRQIERGLDQNWNNGVIYDITQSKDLYNGLKSGTPLPGEDLQYVNFPGTSEFICNIGIQLILIVN